MNKWVAAITLATIFSACKAPVLIQQTAVPVTDDSLLLNALLAPVELKTLSGKIQIQFQSDEEQNQFTAHFRLKKDSLLWLSISPALGIEAFRLLINTDSVLMIDRIKDTTAAFDFSFFQNMIPFPAGFSEMQSFLLGSPVLPSNMDSTSLLRTDSAYKLTGHSPHTLHSVEWNRNLQLVSQEIKGNNFTVTAEQSNYDISWTPAFSLWRKINILHLKPASLTLTFSNLKRNEALSFPFQR